MIAESRPLFIDNRNGNTLAQALRNHMSTLRGKQASPCGVCIATAFFNVRGFDLIAAELQQAGKVRLLLGTEPRPETIRPRGRSWPT